MALHPLLLALLAQPAQAGEESSGSPMPWPGVEESDPAEGQDPAAQDAPDEPLDDDVEDEPLDEVPLVMPRGVPFDGDQPAPQRELLEAPEADDAFAVEPGERELPPPSLRFWVGPRLGLAVHAEPLRPSVLPVLELGLVLPFADERLRPYASGGWTAPSADLSGEHASLDEGWQATVRQDEVRLGGGLAVRILGRRAPVSPEVRGSGQAWLGRTTTETRSGAVALSTARESGTVAAGSVGLGLVGAVGPGQVGGHLDLSLASASGVLTGDGSLRSIDFSFGYRLEL